MSRPRVGAAGILFAVIAGSPAAAQWRPTSYAEFDVSIPPGDGAALQNAITRGQRNAIYLQPGHYVLNNPVVIDRTTPLFIHGADRQHVRLVAADPTKPLLVVRAAPLVNFASVRFYPTTVRDAVDSRSVVTNNVAPIHFELQDCLVDHSTLEFAGPGSYRIQSCMFSPGGRVKTPVLIDHPGADVLIFGGDSSNDVAPLRAADFAHVWQKRGRVRIYATTFEATLGPSDVRIETRSGLGPHVMANIRSEGANGALNETGAVSRLLFVPPTTERVDVLLKANGGAWQTGPPATRDTRVNCKLGSYNGAGTLWLLLNRADYCGRYIVEGDAPQATIVSVGNLIGGPQPFNVRAARIITALDGFDHHQWTGLTTDPRTRWFLDGSNPPKLTSYLDIPEPPQDVLPPALERPTVTAALPGMLDVKNAPFGAKGDGVTDDTAAIQRALDAQCDLVTPKVLFFPAGTYRIRNTLYLNHHSGGACHDRLAEGGWIAGAGSSRTIIAMDPAVKKGTFATDGLTFATVQGITFKTWPWRTGDPKEPNVDLEFYPGYLSTQLNHFYDVVFDGGYAAFAAGVRAPNGGSCSSTAVYRGRMMNAHIGFVSGHYNALANLVYDSELIDNDYAFGQWTVDPTVLSKGGTYYAYRSTSRGTRVQDFLIEGVAQGSIFYFYEWTSDAPAYLATSHTAASYPLMFDRSHLSPRQGVLFPFDMGSAQGPFFLFSSLLGGRIRVGQAVMSQGFAIKMASDISDWSTSVTSGPNGVLDAISWSTLANTPASLGVPGQPMLVY